MERILISNELITGKGANSRRKLFSNISNEKLWLIKLLQPVSLLRMKVSPQQVTWSEVENLKFHTIFTDSLHQTSKSLLSSCCQHLQIQ